MVCSRAWEERTPFPTQLTLKYQDAVDDIAVCHFLWTEMNTETQIQRKYVSQVKDTIILDELGTHAMKITLTDENPPP